MTHGRLSWVAECGIIERREVTMAAGRLQARRMLAYDIG